MSRNLGVVSEQRRSCRRHFPADCCPPLSSRKQQSLQSSGCDFCLCQKQRLFLPSTAMSIRIIEARGCNRIVCKPSTVLLATCHRCKPQCPSAVVTQMQWLLLSATIRWLELQNTSPMCTDVPAICARYPGFLSLPNTPPKKSVCLESSNSLGSLGPFDARINVMSTLQP